MVDLRYRSRILGNPGLEKSTAIIEKGSFNGRLQKGILERWELREATLEDREQSRTYNVIIVKLVINHDRTWNWDYLHYPPRRTGKFDRFMDEVEDVAKEFGIANVLVEHVAHEFLPSKLERRGYFRVDSSLPRRPNYLK